MTPRKENALIWGGTLLLIGVLTLWRMSVLTMQEDTGPLPAGQRSLKPVDLHASKQLMPALEPMVIAFELARGVQVRRSILDLDNPKGGLPDLNASSLCLVGEHEVDREMVRRFGLESTLLGQDSVTSAKPRYYLLHVPLDQADSNVTDLAAYLTQPEQVDRLLKDDSP